MKRFALFLYLLTMIISVAGCGKINDVNILDKKVSSFIEEKKLDNYYATINTTLKIDVHKLTAYEPIYIVNNAFIGRYESYYHQKIESSCKENPLLGGWYREQYIDPEYVLENNTSYSDWMKVNYSKDFIVPLDDFLNATLNKVKESTNYQYDKSTDELKVILEYADIKNDTSILPILKFMIADSMERLNCPYNAVVKNTDKVQLRYSFNKDNELSSLEIVNFLIDYTYPKEDGEEYQTSISLNASTTIYLSNYGTMKKDGIVAPNELREKTLTAEQLIDKKEEELLAAKEEALKHQKDENGISDNWEDFEFLIDGNLMNLTSPYSTFENMGYSINYDISNITEDLVLDTKSQWTEVFITDTNNTLNPNDFTITAKLYADDANVSIHDGKFRSFKVKANTNEFTGTIPEFIACKQITWGSSEEEILKAYADYNINYGEYDEDTSYVVINNSNVTKILYFWIDKKLGVTAFEYILNE